MADAVKLKAKIVMAFRQWQLSKLQLWAKGVQYSSAKLSSADPFKGLFHWCFDLRFSIIPFQVLLRPHGLRPKDLQPEDHVVRVAILIGIE